jgi:hypothetical protein
MCIRSLVMVQSQSLLLVLPMFFLLVVGLVVVAITLVVVVLADFFTYRTFRYWQVRRLLWLVPVVLVGPELIKVPLAL